MTDGTHTLPAAHPSYAYRCGLPGGHRYRLEADDEADVAIGFLGRENRAVRRRLDEVESRVRLLGLDWPDKPGRQGRPGRPGKPGWLVRVLVERPEAEGGINVACGGSSSSSRRGGGRGQGSGGSRVSGQGLWLRRGVCSGGITARTWMSGGGVSVQCVCQSPEAGEIKQI
jgi:hypothetical protein